MISGLFIIVFLSISLTTDCFAENTETIENSVAIERLLDIGSFESRPFNSSLTRSRKEYTLLVITADFEEEFDIERNGFSLQYRFYYREIWCKRGSCRYRVMFRTIGPYPFISFQSQDGVNSLYAELAPSGLMLRYTF